LNKTRYKNVIARFKERTGIVYTRIEFKNRCNKLKQDYDDDDSEREDVLICIVSTGANYIRPNDPNFSNDRRIMPHFKDAIGALDGIHISATPCHKDLIKYIGRSGIDTQNVAIVDFDMRFTYASIGHPWPMHDTIFHSLERDPDTFPHPALGMSDHLSYFFLMSLPKCIWLIHSFLTCLFR
jgi:hypothetical protein